MIRPSRGPWPWALLLSAAALAAAPVYAAEDWIVPRDEPEPAPEGPPPSGVEELPDYGPPPMAEPPSVAKEEKPTALVIPQTPRFKLTYARFDAHRIGGRAQPFNVAGLTLYLLSGWVRVGATTRFGLEDAAAGQERDFFVDESVSLGVQAPGLWRHVVPFAELNGGVGIRVLKSFHDSFIGAQWSLGLDVGAELYLAGRFYLTAALGWLRPVVSIETPTADYIHSDAFIFKVGLGL